MAEEVYIFSQDFTSMGGTLSEIHARKICNLIDSAMKKGCPVIGINDSGGARIQDGVDALAGYGQIFYRNTLASGIVPQICAILGPCAGGAVYSPALMDFIFMVKRISYAFITGPRVVKAVMGKEIGEEELGGAIVAQRKAGVVCRSEDSEEECLQSIRELLSYLPSSNREKRQRVDWGDTPDRTDTALFDIVPANPSKPYDMHKIIERVFDQRQDGKNYFELFPLFATNIITCFSRLNGWSVGIIANQPMSKAGALDARAIIICHGYSGDCSPDLVYAPLLHKAGYHLLFFDFRGHGASDGDYTSLVYFERDDVLAALDLLCARGITRVGLLGFSMGGAVAIGHGAAQPAGRRRDQRLHFRGIVAHHAPSRAAARCAGAVRVGRGLAHRAWLASIRLRANLFSADPVRWIGKIAPCPVLIMHGAADADAPVAEAHQLFRAAREPKELWLVPGAAHRKIEEVAR